MNSVHISMCQKDVRPSVQKWWRTMSFSRVSIGDSVIPSSCEMKYEPAFKPLQGIPAFFWSRTSRGPFHLRQKTHSNLATTWTATPQAPLSPRVCSNSCPLSQCCYLTILFSAAPFSFCCQSFPSSGSFPMSQFFASGDQSIGASASASALSMNNQDWFPLGLTCLISWQSKKT